MALTRKAPILFIIVLVAAFFAIQFATSSHTSVFIANFNLQDEGSVLEDTSGTYSIPDRIFPLMDPSNTHPASDFNYSISNIVPTTSTVQVSSTATDVTITAKFPDAGTASFSLTATDKNNASLTATKTISATVTATDAEAFFTNGTQ